MGHFAEASEGWRKVVNSKHSTGRRVPWDVANGGRTKATGDKVTSLFITEFGDNWKANDLYFELKEFGEIDEVVISPNRDKRGRKFGFVRFLNVLDDKILAIKIDSVMLEGRKLFANLPRFQRVDKNKFKSFSQRGTNSEKPLFSNGKGSSGRVGLGWVDNRSFVDVMLNRKEHDRRKRNAGSTKTISLSSEEDDLIRYGRAFTGTLKDAAMAPVLKSLFVEEGIFTIRVTTLGPSLCLLEDLIYGEVEIFIEERREWWQQWFSRIVPWKPFDIDLERFAWISVRGIPCHAWGSNLFKLIANLYGSFIKCDDLTISRIKMEEARIFIKSRQQTLINEVCMVSVDGISYKLFVQEDFPNLQSLGQLRIAKEEEFSKELSSPTEVNSFEEEGGYDSDMHNFSLNSTAAHLGKDSKGEGSGTVEERPEGALVLDHQRLSGNMENNILKEDKAFFAFSENNSSTPILVPISDVIPNAINDSDLGLLGSGRKERDFSLTDGHSCFLVGKGFEGGIHKRDKAPCNRRNSSGPLEEVEIGPLSFDSECRKVALTKPKSSDPNFRKKKRPIQDLGDRIVPSPSFYSALAPRKSNSITRIVNDGVIPTNETGADPNGTFVPCISHTDSEVMRCNSRQMSATKSETEVGRKVWKSIEKLGVVSGEEESLCIKKVEGMEKRDKLGLKGKLALSNGVS